MSDDEEVPREEHAVIAIGCQSFVEKMNLIMATLRMPRLSIQSYAGGSQCLCRCSCTAKYQLVAIVWLNLNSRCACDAVFFFPQVVDVHKPLCDETADDTKERIPVIKNWLGVFGDVHKTIIARPIVSALLLASEQSDIDREFIQSLCEWIAYRPILIKKYSQWVFVKGVEKYNRYVQWLKKYKDYQHPESHMYQFDNQFLEKMLESAVETLDQLEKVANICWGPMELRQREITGKS